MRMFFKRKNLVKGEKGLVLLEALIALVLLSFLAGALLLAMATATKDTAVADYRTTAESLAYGQMEAIKAATYQPATNGGSDGWVYSYAFTPPSNSHFVIWTTNNAATQASVSNKIYGIPWNVNTSSRSTTADTGVQQVTIIIKFNGQTIFTLVDFVSSS